MGLTSSAKGEDIFFFLVKKQLCLQRGKKGTSNRRSGETEQQFKKLLRQQILVSCLLQAETIFAV